MKAWADKSHATIHRSIQATVRKDLSRASFSFGPKIRWDDPAENEIGVRDD